MKVFFVGAGPGDPKLITLKGKEIIEEADIIIYAGSLVNKKILDYARSAKEQHDSAKMNLDEMVTVFKKAKDNNWNLARIHSGDPSIYGAINEQMRELDKLGISYEVIPGVSSFQAAAAALCQELTLPEVCQTITLSRISGRTPVPDKERLEVLAKSRSTLFLFLSISKLREVMETISKEYGEKIPVAVVYRASWPDQKIIKGDASNIVEKVEEEKITKTALILIGEVLDQKAKASLLYDKGFSHMFRESKTGAEVG